MSLYVTLLVVSLLVAAFAAGAETALTSASRIRIRSLAEDGNRRARRVVRLREDPNAYLSTILTLNTIAVIVASTAGALLAVQSLPRVPEAVETIVLSFIVLVLCEITPKSLALHFADRVALAVAAPVAWLTRALRPVVLALTGISRLLLVAFTRHADVRGPFVTEEELKMLVTMSEEAGVVEIEEREMIHGILEMTDKAVREVMVPRVDVVGIEADATSEEAVALVMEHGHSRIPVYEETIDNVVGVVYAKDLLRHRAAGRPGPVKGIARAPYFTPDAKRVGELLHEMQQRKVHMAIVVDEYGGTAGIVTIEDLIEEIVGPIRDEYDVAEQEEIQFVSEHEVLMNARVAVDDVKELLGIEVGESEAESIGGVVYERLGEIPEVGRTLPLGNATLTVESVRRQSIQTIRITSPQPFTLAARSRHEEAAAETGADTNGTEPDVEPR